jgi:UV DNA damage endonuclease
VRYRTVTRKTLLQLTPEAQQEKLRNLYTENLERLNKAIDYCIEKDIKLYRLTSALLPFADDPVGGDLLEEFAPSMRRIGERATAVGLRIVLHPDQFVVLNSDSPQVIENSLKILNTHALIMDLLAQPRSAWTTMEIHGGKSDRAEKLIEVVGELPEAVRSRIAFENDEYSYSAQQILEICRAARVPMVFDAHHHLCHENLTSYDDESIARMLGAARETWPVPEWQLVHISNGRTAFNDRHHSDLISVMPPAFRAAPWIEVEAKHKEFAIDKLRAEWLTPDFSTAA